MSHLLNLVQPIHLDIKLYICEKSMAHCVNNWTPAPGLGNRVQIIGNWRWEKKIFRACFGESHACEYYIMV